MNAIITLPCYFAPAKSRGRLSGGKMPRPKLDPRRCPGVPSRVVKNLFTFLAAVAHLGSDFPSHRHAGAPAVKRRKQAE